ncbi:MAG: 8-amino-7-oxononanoate synthase [Gemmatimonas sp.]|uniref:8-amino-7-oxononanoate synthase n=1 Tax=Gemmatimonas sp. TaxID=1962908 RepID=UPI00391F5A20|nr:8-amino-7-oxononanoate synthase [Gemmatimonadota bacterium]
MTNPIVPLMPPSTMNAALDEELRGLEAAGLKRALRQVQQRRAGTVLVHGERLVDFASNDYLGLASDPRVARAAQAVLQAEGTGAAAARLISGNYPIHETLEHTLARLKGCAYTLLFPSGYMVNVGAIPALVGRGDVIYSDALNHASLIDGCRLSRATVRVFPHNDLEALAAMLAAERSAFRRALIVVEGVFSMDGDTCPLDRLVPLARRHQAWTYVDDAHGTGVLGATGAGSVEHFGVTGEVDVVVGTLGKALGTAGAYVGGSQELVELLVSRARSFIFTTGSPPALAAATLEALRIADVEPWRREAVRARGRRLRERLQAAGFAIAGPPDGHIVPVLVGDPVRTMAIVADLRRRGFLVGGVRPPTVPVGTSRLRISLSAVHPMEMVDALAATLVATLRKP